MIRLVNVDQRGIFFWISNLVQRGARSKRNGETSSEAALRILRLAFVLALRMLIHK
jgi:hypothetical protein